MVMFLLIVVAVSVTALMLTLLIIHNKKFEDLDSQQHMMHDALRGEFRSLKDSIHKLEAAQRASALTNKARVVYKTTDGKKIYGKTYTTKVEATPMYGGDFFYSVRDALECAESELRQVSIGNGSTTIDTENGAVYAQVAKAYVQTSNKKECS